MSDQKQLYSIDHGKSLLEAVELIKEHCTKIKECPECPFWDDENGCIIDGYPEYWEV